MAADTKMPVGAPSCGAIGMEVGKPEPIVDFFASPDRQEKKLSGNFLFVAFILSSFLAQAFSNYPPASTRVWKNSETF